MSAGWSDLKLQDGDLVAQHQDLGVLDIVRAGQQSLWGARSLRALGAAVMTSVIRRAS